MKASRADPAAVLAARRRRRAMFLADLLRFMWGARPFGERDARAWAVDDLLRGLKQIYRSTPGRPGVRAELVASERAGLVERRGDGWALAWPAIEWVVVTTAEIAQEAATVWASRQRLRGTDRDLIEALATFAWWGQGPGPDGQQLGEIAVEQTVLGRAAGVGSRRTVVAAVRRLAAVGLEVTPTAGKRPNVYRLPVDLVVHVRAAIVAHEVPS